MFWTLRGSWQLIKNGLDAGYRPLHLIGRRTIMPKYVIEREIPGAGKLTAVELQGVSQTSCDVLQKLGPEIQWVHSYVTGDKVYCVYIAPNEELIREHAQQGGFPANRISEIKTIIDPTTAEEKQQSVTG